MSFITRFTKIQTNKQENKYCIECGQANLLVNNSFKCSACGKNYYKQPSLGVSVVVEAEGKRIILCKRRPYVYAGGKWCLPCGYIEYEEDYVTAAEREVFEETKIIVEIHSLMGVYDTVFSDSRHTVVIALLAKYHDGVLTATDDIEDALWLDEKHINLYDFAFDADKKYVLKFFNDSSYGIPL